MQVIACVASRTATRTAMVLIDVLKRAEQRAGELAEAASQARSRGVTCETAYDGISKIGRMPERMLLKSC